MGKSYEDFLGVIALMSSSLATSGSRQLLTWIFGLRVFDPHVANFQHR